MLTQYQKDHHIKEMADHETSTGQQGHLRARARTHTHTQTVFLAGKHNMKQHFEVAAMDGRLILKCTLKKLDGRGLIPGSTEEQLAGAS
jgi:hypothetical protein